MLYTNIYEYADIQEYEYADIHEYEYANIYEYKFVETQKMKKQKRKKKTFSTGTKVLHLRCLRGRHFSTGRCYGPVLKCTFSTRPPDRY